MHSFRIIVKTPDHLVGHNDAVLQRSGWIEREEADRWLVVLITGDARADHNTNNLPEAISFFSLKLAGIEA